MIIKVVYFLPFQLVTELALKSGIEEKLAYW